MAPTKQILSIGVQGFTLRIGPDEPFLLEWNAVDKVTFWKRDLLTVDQICLKIESTSLKSPLLLTEDEMSWKSLVRCLDKYIIGFDSNWWGKVAMPPFEVCEYVAFDRSALENPST